MKNITTMNSDQKGHLAETLAAWYLRSKGYKILRRRYKTAIGEVDLIARKGNYLVFTEVKCRQHIDEGLYAISAKSQARIRRTAEHYLTLSTDKNTELQPRFDVIVVRLYHHFHHIKNAF